MTTATKSNSATVAGIVEPHAKGIITEVNAIKDESYTPLPADQQGKLTMLGADMDAPYLERVETMMLQPPITARVLYMPSESDMYFPITDARYEQPFLKRSTFMPIPTLWGHAAGGGGNPADAALINVAIRDFLAR